MVPTQKTCTGDRRVGCRQCYLAWLIYHDFSLIAGALTVAFFRIILIFLDTYIYICI